MLSLALGREMAVCRHVQMEHLLNLREKKLQRNTLNSLPELKPYSCLDTTACWGPQRAWNVANSPADN
jgi:hypothetical protein